LKQVANLFIWSVPVGGEWPRKAETSTSVALKSINARAADSCREIHALSGLRSAGFEHHP
jgi:hypothetical protein